MDLSLLFLHRQWLAGRSLAEDRPNSNPINCASGGTRNFRKPTIIRDSAIFIRLIVSFPGVTFRSVRNLPLNKFAVAGVATSQAQRSMPRKNSTTGPNICSRARHSCQRRNTLAPFSFSLWLGLDVSERSKGIRKSACIEYLDTSIVLPFKRSHGA